MAAPDSGTAGASGSGACGGATSGANPTSLASAMRHMLTVDDDDFDCTIKLVVPGEPAAEAGTSPGARRPAKRAKQDGGTAAAPAAEPQAFLTCHASSVALKQHSEVFRRWMKGWMHRKKRKQRHTLQIECDDPEEAHAFQRLLDYVHSVGRVLPEEPSDILALLTVARKHGVESCVDACLQLLPAKVEQLPLQGCLRLLLLLETGMSGNEAVQGLADQLMQRSSARLCTLLTGKAAAVTAANEELQAELALFLGRWHYMLNCSLRRTLWLGLPFEVLLAMFDDAHVHADTEATVLAAFALWANANIAAKKELVPEDRQRIAAVCSRIRFPAVPPDVLVNYWACFGWLQLYDERKELTLRAVATAADKQQQFLWRGEVEAAEHAPPAVAASTPRSACLLWWTEREPELVSDTDTVTFELQMAHPGDADETATAPVYWRGYYWQCKLGVSAQGEMMLTVRAGCSADPPRFATYATNPWLYQTRASYCVRLRSSGAGEGSIDPLESVSAFRPASFFSTGALHALDSTTWERFWAAGSPFLYGGCAQLELTLRVPPS